MPRRERFILAGQPHHVVQRGNNREEIFFDEEDYLHYKKCLFLASERYGCDLHAYCLMTNHVHLLVTPKKTGGLSLAMQMLGRNYVRHINDKYGRTGTLWEGRFRVSPVDADTYLFSCMRYIENNPVRARMARKPENYLWSSYHANALGEADCLIHPHKLYKTLGKERLGSYKALFRADGNEDTDMIREAVQGNWVLGSVKFKAMAEHKSGQPSSPRPRGGDRKSEKFREKSGG